MPVTQSVLLWLPPSSQPEGQNRVVGKLELDDEATCPFCNGPLERGYVTGRVGRIRWIPTSSKWMRFIGGASLAVNWLAPPLLDGARCPSCGLGLYAYDPEVNG